MSKFHCFNIFLTLTLLLFVNIVLSTPIANPEPEPVADPNPSSVTSAAETTQDIEKRYFGGGFGGYGAGYQNQAGYSSGMYGGYGGLGGLGYGGLGYGGLGYGGLGYGGMGYGGLGYGGLGGVPILKKRDIDTNTPQQQDFEKRDPSATQDAQPFVLVKRVADPFIGGGGMGMGFANPGVMGALPLAAMPAAALPIAALPAAGYGMI
ncbi:18168_t:CDS:1 [Acaulospora morrowiae]|uniref:18168_t:CDS:1 n=1 Tax=Acaulospora morrowiae TaxID=94023 RepID=A0A9N9G4K3_9GLOM|nr:18168_t:CDS:1 [Acaulospora morrowiae]